VSSVKTTTARDTIIAGCADFISPKVEPSFHQSGLRIFQMRDFADVAVLNEETIGVQQTHNKKPSIKRVLIVETLASQFVPASTFEQVEV
jgi:hypothetical protein